MTGFLTKILAVLLLLLAANSAYAWTISGTVSQAGMGPLDGAQVDVNTLAGAFVDGNSTDANGNYSIAGIANGVYTITATYSTYKVDGNYSINADKDLNFTMPGVVVKISGTVTNTFGVALGGAAVRVLKGTSQLASTVTLADGTYSVSVLANTDYNVTASLVGHNSDTKAVTVAAGNVAGQDFALLNLCDVDGDGVNSTACGGTDCDDASAAVHPGAAETCNGIDDDCDALTADGSGEAAPLNTNQVGVCALSTQACAVGAWTDDYTGIAGYPDSCVAAAAAPPAPTTTATGGGGGGGGGTRGDANCKPAPVGLGIGVSGWLCSANEACIGGITWNSPHVEGGVCCNVQCTAVASVEEETPPLEEQPAPVETPRETTNPVCNDLNPCTIDTYDSVLEVCNNRAADNDIVCYANGQKGVCDFGTCKVPSAPVAPAVPAGPTGFAVFGDFFAAISGAIGAFVQWILGLFG